MQTNATTDPPRNQAVLHLWGPEGLTIDGRSIKLRRKGLALLFYLAIEGATRRERIADLLWDQAGASQNLRVELHRLKASVAPHGLRLFSDCTRSLKLAEGVRLDDSRRPGMILEGLDDLAVGYQEWLDQLRLAKPRLQDVRLHGALIDELAEHVAPPYVLVVVGNPGSGRRQLARDLAHRLGLPISERFAEMPVVRYVVSEEAPLQLADTIASDARNVWVVERSAFGEDPDFLVKLRSVVAAERMRFVRLSPLPWWEAKQLLPSDTSFGEGARLFLASTGNPSYLNELLKLREQVEPGTELPVPLSMRAKFALEARRLTPQARRSLEKLSIHCGAISDPVLRALDVGPELTELETACWLEFDGVSWRFKSELARRMLADVVPRGARHQTRESLARAVRGNASYVAGSAESEAKWGTSRGSLPEPSTEPVLTFVKVGDEVLLEPPEITDESAVLDGAKLIFSRGGNDHASTNATWVLEDEPHLFRLRGRALVEDACSTDPSEPIATIVLSLPGSGALDFHVTQVDSPAQFRGGILRAPSTPFFEYWLLAPIGRVLRIESWARSAVVELRMSAFRPTAIEPFATAARGFVEAFVLESNRDDSEAEPMSMPDKVDLTVEQRVV